MRLSIAANAATAHVLLTVHPPSSEEPPAPLDVCCVLDVSGSMGHPVNVHDAHGHPIPGSDYTSLPSALSLARYLLRAVVTGLNDTDRFSFVTFADDSHVVIPLSRMGADDRTRALEEIDDCNKPQGGSNLWSGLDTGLKILSDPHRVRVLLLLSDGNANYDGNTDRLMSASMKRGVIVHTLGVSDRPNGARLSAIAQDGGGQLAHVPNTACAMPIVGNLLANARASYGHQSTLSVRIHWEGDRAGRLDVLGGLAHVPERDWSGVQVELGPLLHHRPQHVLLRVRNGAPLLAQHPDKPFVSATLSCVRLDGITVTATAIATKSLLISGSPEDEAAMVRCQAARCELVDAVLDMKSAGLNASYTLPILRSVERLRAVEALILENQNSELGSNLRQDFRESLFGGLPDRLSADFERKIVLMNSVALAHLRERHVDDSVHGTRFYLVRIPTFIDPDIRPPECDAHMHNWIRDAPRPTFAQELSATIASWLPQPPRREVPCFDGTCLIALADGSDMTVSDLRPGMCVATPQGPRAVHSIVRTPVHSNTVNLCTIGALRVTPWHPIMHDGHWTFPAAIAPAQHTACAAVYSVLLERRPLSEAGPPALFVGGIWCAPLGHGVVCGDSVLQHRYLGDWDAVAHDLSTLPMENGMRLARKCVRVAGGTVSGFV